MDELKDLHRGKCLPVTLYGALRVLYSVSRVNYGQVSPNRVLYDSLSFRSVHIIAHDKIQASCPE